MLMTDDDEDAEYSNATDQDADDASDEDQPKPKSQHGGWRPHSGRKKGSLNTIKNAKPSKAEVARERVDEAMSQIGVTLDGTEFEHCGPLETMEYAMRT
jgi:hypothetical protein